MRHKYPIYQNEGRKLNALLLTFVLIILFFIACKKSKESTDAPVLEKVTLISPLKNAACTSGTETAPGQVKVALVWRPVAGAQLYEVRMTNLTTNVSSSYQASTPRLEANLTQNTPYSWSVVAMSENASTTSESETWKFFVAGEATSSYAPFPADSPIPALASVVNATNGKVSLAWSAADADGDIAAYNLYFGTSESTLQLTKTNLSESVARDINVASATTYYWKVQTKDSKGNTSVSDIWHFRTAQ